MSIRSILRRLFLALLVAAPLASHAQLFRAYLSVNGNDSNACTLPAPCRLLPKAVSVVADGGEIWMLDSANYNTGLVVITKSVSIIAIPGAVGSLVANGADALAVGGTNTKISLKNLVFAPIAGSVNGTGVSAVGPMTLSVEGCSFSRLPGNGISADAGTILRVRNSTFRDNSSYGIVVQGGSTASIDRTILDGNDAGVFVNVYLGATTTRASITNSTITGNNNGILALGTAAGSATIWAQGNTIASNTSNGINPQILTGGGTISVKAVQNTIVGNGGTAIFVIGAGAKALVSGNTITDNLRALDNTNGTIEKVVNNVIRDNANPDIGSVTTITVQ